VYFKRISDLRIDNDLTQKDISKTLNVPRNTYSKWELGTVNMPLDKLEEFAEYFNVSIDYVLGLSDDKKNNSKGKFDREILRRRLKKVRNKNNTSEIKLSSILKMPQTTYSGYENGHSIMPLTKLYNFAQYFNVSVDYLMGRK